MSSRRLTVLGTALATVAAGLVSASTLSPAAAGSLSATPTVEVLIKRNHTLVMPSEIQPGVSKFVVTSRRESGFQIVQAEEGYPKRRAIRDINAAFNADDVEAMKRFEDNVTLHGGLHSHAEGRRTMSVRLDPGAYWALDTTPRTLEAAKVVTFWVAGESVGGKLSGHVLRATGEHTWGKMSPSIPRQGQIRFQNHSDANHFLSIVKLAKGKTMRDFREWMEELKQGNEGPPPVNFKFHLDTGVISGGRTMTLKYRLSPGRYVMTCWWPDTDMEGMPHAMMGMYRGLTVQ